MVKIPQNRLLAVFAPVFIFILSGLYPVSLPVQAASGASLYMSPASGAYVVGGTFTVSVVLNTGGNFINAIQADLAFPPDTLQVVSPSLGYSIINIWTNQPRFDNVNGTLSFQGGIPNPGINTDKGIVATITFRVKSVGQALVKFLDSSKVLLNDGLATDILSNKGDGIYDLTLPPPRGPVVVSESQPDQSRWYQNSTAALRWANPIPVAGYSYILNDEPIDIPDDISEGPQDHVVYKGLADGLHFFHVKAFRNVVWGDTTHFAIKIDSTPAADFPIEISPSSRTSNHRPLINFLTTDSVSGMDHYEIKIIPLSLAAPDAGQNRQSFFTEATSPYSVALALGVYDVIVRAYDKAGNFREVTQRLAINTPLQQILELGFLPHWLAILVDILLLLGALYAAKRVWLWHRKVHLAHLMGAMKNPEIAAKLKQLQDKRSEYMKRLLVFVLAAALLFGFAKAGNAQTALLSPPIVTTIAKNVSNDELFYIGGKAVAPGGNVIVYLQSLHDGETFSNSATVDSKGDWFYSYPQFLSPGQYLVWAQLKIGNQLSAPSAQMEVVVSQTAIQLGASRISYETLYLVFTFILLIALLGTLGFILYHGYHGRNKHKKLRREIVEAEESIKRGFLLLHRDLKAEMEVINRRKLNANLTPEEQEKEKRLARDLDWIGAHIEKEVRDIDRLMGQ